jgi:tellurite resistance protein
MSAKDSDHIDRVAAKLSQPPPAAPEGSSESILKAAAAYYGSRPTDDEVTQPTGFDPRAAALFEAVVEGAYLVATADGEFDEAERATFQHVVLKACGGRVQERQVGALIADLEELLVEDGADKRVRMLARTVDDPEHRQEVLRVATLLAGVSGGVNEHELAMLRKLAAGLGIDEAALSATLAEVEHALGC